MSLFSNQYLMNLGKNKIKNKNKLNKYIASKPSFLMKSNTYRYFQEKDIINKKINMTLTTNNFENINKPIKNNIYNYGIKSPMNINRQLLTTKNSKEYFSKFNNDENKENLKNIYNTSSTARISKNKIDRSFLINNYYKTNSNKENINTNMNANSNNNNNFKKINIKQKKKGRTLSSNINKICQSILDNKNAVKTYRNNNPKKESSLILNDLVPYHKKSHSIILSENNLNLFPSKSFRLNNLLKLKQSQENNKSLINNKSVFNNTTNQFYSRLKQIIPIENNNNTNLKNKINDYMTKDFSKFNKSKKNYKTKPIASLTNIDLYLNKSKDSFLSNKNKNSQNSNNSNKIIKKILKIDSCTIPGYSLKGVKQKNLDSFFLKKNFLEKEENFFIGICDGHGIYGDLISQYIAQNLPELLKNISKENIIQIFKDLNKALISRSKIDCSLSGTTCTSLIISLEKIICANIGNTRAILARHENGCYNTIILNRDHKPTESEEIKRIITNGGVIRQNYDKIRKEYIGPERIWLKNSDIPGLNMSRTFGDNLAHTIGVINIPEIRYYEFTGNEKFIVIASDSIWQFIDSDECTEIIKEFYEKNLDAIGALNALVTEAIKRWKKQENKIEDITAVVIFFE